MKLLETKQKYETPLLEVVSVSTERGFAATGDVSPASDILPALIDGGSR